MKMTCLEGKKKEKQSAMQLQDQINESNSVSGFKDNIQESIVFLCTKSKHTEI